MSRPDVHDPRPADPRAADREALVALALAAVCFGATFRGPPASFWRRMTATATVLGSVARTRREAPVGLRLRLRHVVQGTAIAAGLYGVFRVGDAAARRVLPRSAGDIDAIYGLRSGHDPKAIALRLATVIGPAEELFWRGYLQGLLSERWGRWRGSALAAGAYAAVHVPSGNPTLVGAAAVAGTYWSALAAAGVDMESLIVSHVLWDIVIFLVAPVSG